MITFDEAVREQLSLEQDEPCELNVPHADVLRMRFVEFITLRECGERMGGKSCERARQAEGKALRFIRQHRKWSIGTDALVAGYSVERAGWLMRAVWSKNWSRVNADYLKQFGAARIDVDAALKRHEWWQELKAYDASRLGGMSDWEWQQMMRDCPV